MMAERGRIFDKKDLKNQLDPIAYAVTQESATEPAFSGEYYEHTETGLYNCVVCSAVLFSSEAKFHSGSGWPSFNRPTSEAAVAQRLDTTHNMIREEVVCGSCDGHLGHVFLDGPVPTGVRYCINSAALKFEPTELGVD